MGKHWRGYLIALVLGASVAHAQYGNVRRDRIFMSSDSGTTITCLAQDPAPTDRLFVDTDCDGVLDSGESVFSNPYRFAADCTTQTGGITNEFCIDNDTANGGIYICPSPGDCNGTTAWVRVDDNTGGAEVNDLEGTVPSTILDNETFVGTGAGTGTFIALSTCGAGSHLDFDGAAFACESDADTSCTLGVCTLGTDDTITLEGGTTVTAILDDEVMIGSGAGTVAFGAIPDCTDAGGGSLNYTASSNSFQCGTDAGAGGGMTSFDVQGDDGAPNVVITDANVLVVSGGNAITTEDGDAGADTLSIAVTADSINQDELASSITFGTADNIVLPIEAADQTTDGEIDYDTTEEVIEVGDDGLGTLKFYPGVHTTDTGPIPDCTGTELQDAAGTCVTNLTELNTSLGSSIADGAHTTDTSCTLGSCTVGTDDTVTLEGGTTVTAIVDDELMIGSGAGTVAFGLLPNCVSSNYLTYTQATNTFGCEADAGGAEVNDLEATVPSTILDNETFVGTGAGTGTFIALSTCGAGSHLDFDGAAFACESDADTTCSTAACTLGTDDTFTMEGGTTMTAAAEDETIVCDTAACTYRPLANGALKYDTTTDVFSAAACSDVTGCVTSAITSTGVTYENLSANGDIGFGSAQVPQGSLAAPLASPTFTGTPAAPTAAASTDTTQIATTAYVKDQEHTVCKTIESLVAADDDVPLFYFNGASTITKIGCDSQAAATVSVQDGGGTDVDADLVCSTGGSITWDSSFTGTSSFTDGERLEIDTISASSPTWTTVCIGYTTP